MGDLKRDTRPPRQYLPEGSIDKLYHKIQTLEEENKQLRKALEHMVCNCIACEGLGHLTEAVQAWDIPGAPVPECRVCLSSRKLLGEADG